MMVSAAASRVISNAATEATRCDEFVSSARVEFYACLQLLAERARYLTGADYAAIALRDDGCYLYRAAAGLNAPEIGSEAEFEDSGGLDSRQPTIRKALVVSVTEESKISGFVRVVSEKFDFGDRDVEAVGRLAEMVSTALAQMRAAENSREVIFSAAEKKQNPILWHAPEHNQVPSPAESSSGTPKLALGVRTCESCGFPVSNGRTMCFDCEMRAGAVPASSALFKTEEPQSWIKEHGYTIATILVSAAAAALIFWLR